MKLLDRITIVIKALRQLGVEQVGFYALYQLGLSTGHYHHQLSKSLSQLKELNHDPYLNLKPCLSGLPNRQTMLDLLGDQVNVLYAQADEIVAGQVRLFGGDPVPLVLVPPQPLSDWTHYEHGGNQVGSEDIKFIWEPGRFGWACTLAMAYHLSKDEKYAAAFWQYTDQFLSANPPYCGPHWSSAQEVALRIVALAFALQAFTSSDHASPQRLAKIAQAIAIHAERISPTLPYARSQNNNHLISEALGLYTAAALLPDHPNAIQWHDLGWKWLQHAFQSQIEPDGTYIQHSTNYHRLMLQAALWMFAVHDASYKNEPIPQDIVERLKSASQWLWKLIDPESGRVPNLGHNDGSYILPLTVCPFHDYRPVIYAAEHRFDQTNLTPSGVWNDFSCWLSTPAKPADSEKNLDFRRGDIASEQLSSQSPHIIWTNKNGSWAYLRVAQFHSRPAHADQLHLDLWWRGLNIALDPGTYLYNAPSPWDNSLTSAFVHNTIVVDDREPMRRAGRFLYLDWGQAEFIPTTPPMGEYYPTIYARHNGYRKSGITHSRFVAAHNDGHWEITDNIAGSPGRKHKIRLHWLLPDWEFEVQDQPDQTEFPVHEIMLQSPKGIITLQVGFFAGYKQFQPFDSVVIKLARAGELLVGTGNVSPNAGWVSTTYGVKQPALAYTFEITDILPTWLQSTWIFPDEA